MTDIDKDSDEFKQAVADAIEEAVSGLKAKNTELIAKNKKLQAGATIDPADLAAVEAERDEWKGKAQAADKAATKAATALEAATKLAAETEAAFNNTLRDSQLTEALTKAGVKSPALLKAAKALMRDDAKVVDDNGARVVKVGEKSLSDHITEWAGTDEGKHFVAAPDTQGGGSHGGRGAQESQGDMGGDKAARLARAETLLKQNAG